MILSVLDKAAGFFSVFFFTINHYLYSKRLKQSFKMDTSNWLYKSEKGWEDYFLNADRKEDSDDESQVTELKHNKINDNFYMSEYRQAIREIYRYNRETQLQVDLAYSILKLEKGKYGAIYIRHGDKLCSESKLFETERYVKLLLEKDPECKTIFVQSDDYNVVLDVQNYIRKNNLDIRIVDIIDMSMIGVITHDRYYEQIETAAKNNANNKNYLSQIKDNLVKSKTIESMSPTEVYNHTMNMIIGIDICCHSKFCILDNQSNVSRFICINHDDHKKAFDIRYPVENVEMHWSMCPAYW